MFGDQWLCGCGYQNIFLRKKCRNCGDVRLEGDPLLSYADVIEQIHEKAAPEGGEDTFWSPTSIAVRTKKHLSSQNESVQGIYVASRASVEARPAMWRRMRDSGVPIVSSWIDVEGAVPDEAMGAMWENDILPEVSRCASLVLYVERVDVPLKGALGEACVALALGKPVYVVSPDMTTQELKSALGSWILHPKVKIFGDVEKAVKAAVSSLRWSN